MAATSASCTRRFWTIALFALGAFCILTLAAGTTCPPATPNPCFNAPGNTSVCCPGACGPSTGVNGVNATCANTVPSAPTISIYVVFNFSLPSANCQNNPEGPGKIGNVCGYNVPIIDPISKRVLGSGIYSETTVAISASGEDIIAKSSHTYFFGTNTPEVAAADALYIEGQTLSGPVVFQNPIVGGIGKYLGAKGYYVSLPGIIETVGRDTILYVPKDIYLVN